MKLTELYRDLSPDLALIEKELEKAVLADHPELQEASLHLLKAGGKRIRPVFVLLCAQFGQYELKEIKNVAVALELIHMASLVHDDVIDDAELRRGRLTIKSKWDNRVAMYTGDYMFAKALELVTQIENVELHRILSDAIVEMTQGEIEQIGDLFNWNQNFRQYLRRVKRKTALLIAVSCRLGSIAAGVDVGVSRRLYRFGYYVGMSFQITDDILDFVGNEKQLGKPAGSDLQQGNVTLPALYALSNEHSRADIVDYLQGTSEIEWKYVLQLVLQSGGIEFSRHLSERYLEKAFLELEALPKTEAKQALYQIAAYMSGRKY